MSNNKDNRDYYLNELLSDPASPLESLPSISGAIRAPAPGASETIMLKSYNGSDIARFAREGFANLEFLPVFGKTDLPAIVRGLSHLISAGPKVGKTELISTWITEWVLLNYTVHIYSEEPLSIWCNALRIGEKFDGFTNIEIIPSIGANFNDIDNRMRTHSADIIVIDTDKVLGIADPNNAGEVTRIISQLVRNSQAMGATLIVLHHHNKNSNERQVGRSISGSHAFLSMCDVSLEIFKQGETNTRKVVGLGRLIEFPTFSYEKADDGSIKLLEEDVKPDERYKKLYTIFRGLNPGEQVKTSDLEQRTGIPRTTLNRMLNTMTDDKVIVKTEVVFGGTPTYSLND